jgi:hypothetical protein
MDGNVSGDVGGHASWDVSDVGHRGAGGHVSPYVGAHVSWYVGGRAP